MEGRTLSCKCYVNPRKLAAIATAQKTATDRLLLVDWAEAFLEGKDRDGRQELESSLSPDQRAAIIGVESQGTDVMREKIAASAQEADDLCDFCGKAKADRTRSIRHRKTGQDIERKSCFLCDAYPDLYIKEWHPSVVNCTCPMPAIKQACGQ